MKVNQAIDLYSVNKRGKLIPIAFQWNKDKYIIEKVNITYKEKDGIYDVLYYSVSIHDTCFKISIHAKDNIPRLREIES